MAQCLSLGGIALSPLNAALGLPVDFELYINAVLKRTSIMFNRLWSVPFVLLSANLYADTEGKIRAVINPDGTIDYVYESLETPTQIASSKVLSSKDIADYAGLSGNQLTSYEIIGGSNETLGFYIGASKEDAEPVSLALSEGLKVKSIPFDAIRSNSADFYKFNTDTGALDGVFLPSEPSQKNIEISQLMPINWSATKLTGFTHDKPVKSYKPVQKDDFIASVRESMLDQAIELACKSRVIPKDISVSASIGASIAFIVGGEGNIAFQATWETEQLCKLKP